MGILKWRVLPVLFVLASVVVFYAKSSSKTPISGCSLLPHDQYWIRSKRIVTPYGVVSGSVEIKGGIIGSIIEGVYDHGKSPGVPVVDYGEAVVMPGLIDVHAHLDEPGRAEWEGFSTGTKAAAAGGVTTLIDMPLNSFPSTVSEESLQLKVEATNGKLYVDVGFWGGLVPENAFNQTALEKLLDAGALGLKSFMCPSGINDFPMTSSAHIKEGLYTLAKYKRPLLVHAEIQQDPQGNAELSDGIPDPRSYITYLETRPPSWEEAAIKELHEVAQDTIVGGRAEGAHLHIVHLSDARASLDIIKVASVSASDLLLFHVASDSALFQSCYSRLGCVSFQVVGLGQLVQAAKTSGASISVETCPHYLAFSAEQIPDGDTRFKCAPPIRDEANRGELWRALMDGHIDFLSSDHSPSIPELKLFEEGNFLKAWGGISSLQFVLPVTWSYGKKYGITLNQLAKWWSERPAKLSGQRFKGAIDQGNHADLVVWEPDIEFVLDDDHDVHHKHRNISAYMGTKLSGKVISTFVRGNLVYSDRKHAPLACGVPILAT